MKNEIQERFRIFQITQKWENLMDEEVRMTRDCEVDDGPRKDGMRPGRSWKREE